VSPSSPLASAAVVADRLRALEGVGARTFAPSAFAFVETLAARGEALGGAAGERLIERAIARADALARELEDAKGRARDTLTLLDDPSLHADATTALERGAVLAPLRAARKNRITGKISKRGPDEAWLARMEAEARARRISFASRASTPLAAALYAASRDELSALLFARRTEAEVPSNAGPYNSLAIAARALAALSTFAPAYLSATVAYLDDLAPLLSLPAPPPDRARPSSVPSRAKRPARRPR
jgi:hypothetical protein